MVDFDVGLALEGGKILSEVLQIGKAIEDVGVRADRTGDRLAAAFDEGTAATIREMQAIRQHTALLAEDVRLRQQEAAATREATEAHRRAREAANEATRARQAQMALGERMAAEIDRERKMILLHSQALEENARRSAGLGTAATAAGAGISRLREPLTGLANSFIQPLPGMTQFTSVLASMTLGGPLTVGLLAGAAAIGFAWKTMGEDARKSREEHEKLIGVLKDLAKEKSYGVAGVTGAATAAARDELLRLSAEVMRLEVERDRQARAGGGMFAAGGITPKIERLKAERDAMEEIVQLGEARVAEIEKEAADKRRSDAEARRDRERAIAEELRQFRIEDLDIQIAAAAKTVAQLDKTTVAYKKIEEAAFKAGVATQAIWLQMAKPGTAPLPDIMPDRTWEQVFALPSTADARKYSDDIGQIFRDGFARIATDGTKSFRDAFEDILQLFSSLMSRMEEEAKRNGGALGGSHTALRLGSAAILGGFAGYQVGQQIGSSGLGLLGGAGAGALAGSAFGPWGAAIGGLVGAAGGLLGAAEAQKQAAAALRAATEAAQGRLNSFVTGGLGSVGAALAGLDANYYSLSQELKKLAASGVDVRGEQGRLGQSYDAQRAKIFGDAIADFAQQTNALNGPAGAYSNALNEIEYQYRKNLETAKALNLEEQLAGQIEDIRRKSIEQLNAALAEQHRQIGEDLEARRLSALGLSEEAEAYRRQVEQRRELDAAMQAGYTDAELAQLKHIQALEAEAAAQEKAAAAAKRNADAQASYQERILRAGGDTDALFAFQQAREAAQIAADLAKGVIDQITAALGYAALEAEKTARANEKARQAAEAARQAQMEALRAQQQAIQEQIRAQEESARFYRDQSDSLRKFSTSLSLGQFSPLSPTQKYQEARNQFEMVGALARSGDRSAIASVQDVVNMFLGASQRRFSSSPGYVSDFARAKQLVDDVSAQTAAQASIQEQILAVLQAQKTVLDQQLARLQPSALPVEIGTQIDKTLRNIPSPGSAIGSGPGNSYYTPGETLTGKNYDPYTGQRYTYTGGKVTDYLGNYFDGTHWYDVEGNLNPWASQGFASGGDFRGGVMRVGERGEELVATGPARVHTAQQLNADVVAELKALRRDIDRLIASNDKQTQTIKLASDAQRERR